MAESASSDRESHGGTASTDGVGDRASAVRRGARRMLGPILAWGGLAAVFLMAAGLRLGMGSSMGWPVGDDAWFIWQLRLHRLELASLVGAALALSGVALQALLRNPLAEPYILGLSTGAGAGIVAQWWLAYALGRSLGASHIGALAGASISMAVVFFASRRRGWLDPLGLLLTGVVLSTINGALILGFNFLAGPGGVREDLIRWMMGFLNSGLSVESMVGVGVVIGVCFIVLSWYGRAMDVASLSDDESQSLGVNLSRLRVVLFVSASVLAAGGVVLAGPIAFVGLICPHVARLMLGPNHRPLLVASAVLGAALVTLADVVSAALHQVFGIGTMPIGIFTALLGGPAFLWMLHPKLGGGYG